MILGSHNTMSYKSPTKWYLKPISFIGKCQKFDLIKQYHIGVRWFDIRIKFLDNGTMCYGHGIFTYDASDFDNVLYFLNNRIDPIYIRLTFEERTYNLKDKLRNYKIELFQNLCKRIEQEYPHITFLCGVSVATKQLLYDFKTYAPIEVEHYSSVCSLFNSNNKFLKIIDDWCPWIYAKLKTKDEYKKYSSDNGYIILDFVNMLV